MSLHLPSRRAALAGSTALRSLSHLPSSSAPPPSSSNTAQIQQRRFKWGDLFRRRDSSSPGSSGATLDSLDDPSVRKKFLAMQQPELASSVFEDEVKAVHSSDKDLSDATMKSKKGTRSLLASTTTTAHPYETTAWRLDPDPRARLRWERKKVIQMVRGTGKTPSRAELIARTERQITHKSEPMPTSVKKLVHLARQISGKTVDDALTQMAFSKKKMAAEIKYHLEEARDRAIVERGMALGGNGEGLAPEAHKNKHLAEIRTKDGNSLRIEDPTRLYIAQAWVGKGEIRRKRLLYKARGRTAMLLSPSTSISVILKEEKTRIREHREREAKEAQRKPWVHLPNRPVTAQRPYYSW